MSFLSVFSRIGIVLVAGLAVALLVGLRDQEGAAARQQLAGPDLTANSGRVVVPEWPLAVQLEGDGAGVALLQGNDEPVTPEGGPVRDTEVVTRDPTTGFPSYPLPTGPSVALGTPGGFGAAFGAPLPQTAVWNPPGQKRVGLQAGHWQTYDVPEELRRLGPGSSAGGWDEWEVNLLVARRTAAILEAAGVQVDLLPTTIPVRYRAHAFISIHADGDVSGRLNGYKMARPGFSSIPAADDDLIGNLYREYGAATGMVRDSDDHISRRMTFYYAFNTRRYHHAIDLGTPAAIIEMGFLTNAGDRAFMTGQADRVAAGIANGVLRFLEQERGRTEWGRVAAAMP